MLGCNGEHPDAFVSAIDALVSNPAGQLTVPANALLAAIDSKQATEIINRTIGEPPRRSAHLIPALTGLLAGGPFGAALGGTASYNVDVFRYNGRIKAVSTVLNALEIMRPTIGFTDAEKALLPAVARTYAASRITPAEWRQFLARLVWNDGQCVLIRPPHLANHKYLPLAEDSLRNLLKATQPVHAVMLEDAAKLVSKHSVPTAVANLSAGARWMTNTDRAASRVYTTDPRRNGLVIGLADDGKPVMFAGNESLITIGGPGTGKTQAQVIPNLLNYPGSAFVLDVKDELWNLTAGRRAQFGPVYRFAPTDPAGNTHAYNPFDVISRDPDQAALDCQLLAHQLILEKPDLKDPYWEERSRDFLWTFAMAIALTAAPHERTLERLAAYLSMPLAFDDLTSAAYKSSDTAKAIVLLRGLAAKTGIPDLLNNAAAIETALTTESNRLESVFDTARRHVATFARAAHVRRATSRSDWHPLDLRKQPGTTVYFCLKPGELRAFAPLVRIVFQQHAAALTKDFSAKPGILPVTFFLDEMPQLGNLAALNDILDVAEAPDCGSGSLRSIWAKSATSTVLAPTALSMPARCVASCSPTMMPLSSLRRRWVRRGRCLRGKTGHWPNLMT